MYRKIAFIIIVILILINSLPLLSPVNAANTFTQAYVRFDRMKTNTTTTGTICAQTTNSATESYVLVTFPTGYTVSTNLINWSVDTNNLPTGATAWPGIGSAINVSGQTVTFPSGNLNTNTLYCFNWSNSNALTTSSSTANAKGTITTKDLTLTVIDTSDYGLTLTGNDQVNVTATVPASSNDLSVSLSSSPVNGSNLQENDIIQLTVTYKSLLNYSTPFYVESYWDKGLIEGTSSDYIEAVDYVVGSATTSDDGTPPVVDLTNKKVYWDISSITPNVDHTVTYQLKVKSNFATQQHIDISVKARGKLVNAYSPEQSVSFVIIPTVQPTTTPTPTFTITPIPTITLTPAAQPTSIPGPNNTPVPPTSAPTIAPTTIPAQHPLYFRTLNITEITADTVHVSFSTSNPVTYHLSYGTTIKSLNQNTSSSDFKTIQDVILSGLKPNTQYFFRIKATDQFGQTIQSDIFTFTTALSNEAINLMPEGFLLTWNKMVIADSQSTEAVLPFKIPVTITTKIDNPDKVDRITAQFVNNQVLGWNVFADEPQVEETQMIEVQPGLFSGELQTPLTIGNYYLKLDIKNTSHGFSTKQIPLPIYISPPLHVVSNQNNEPVEKASIKIEKYEPSLQRYTPLDVGFSLPTYTNENGELWIALPIGSYMLTVNADKYESVYQKMELNRSHPSYPTIKLKKIDTFAAMITYYKKVFNDIVQYCVGSFRDLFISHRTQDMFLFGCELLIIILALINLSLRTHTGILAMILFIPEIIAWKIEHLLRLDKADKILYVFEQNNSHHAISHVDVYIMNLKNHLLYKTKTNPVGKVKIPASLFKENQLPLKIMLYKKGFYSYPTMIDEETANLEMIPLNMIKQEDLEFPFYFSWNLLKFLFTMLSDCFILFMITVAFFYVGYLGLLKSLPLLLCSLLIITLWITDLRISGIIVKHKEEDLGIL